MSTDPHTHKPCDASVLRKSYHPPEFRIYGNIREITQAVGSKGNKDGGTASGMKKSSL